MDPATLAAVAASSLIAALTTDAWEQVRAAMVELWRRVHPGHVDAISNELAEVRQEALAAHQEGDADSEKDLAAEWRRRLQRLLDADPDAAVELQRVLREVLTPALDEQHVAQVRISAQVKGRGRVFQAGRDMHISGMEDPAT